MIYHFRFIFRDKNHAYMYLTVLILMSYRKSVNIFNAASYV